MHVPCLLSPLLTSAHGPILTIIQMKQMTLSDFFKSVGPRVMIVDSSSQAVTCSQDHDQNETWG